MARTKRGFVMQSFLPGGLTPSSSSPATGRVPENPLSMGSMQNPAFVAQPAAKQATPAVSPMASWGVSTAAQGDALNAKMAAASAPPQGSGNKWADLQNAFSKTVISGTGIGAPKTYASSLLGNSAADTDWAEIFGYKWKNNSALQNALKSLGISAPTKSIGLVGGNNLYNDAWQKSMGF